MAKGNEPFSRIKNQLGEQKLMSAFKIQVSTIDGEPLMQKGRMSCRHGLIAGATGTGKTVTLQVLAEGFLQMGVSVLVADIKGDLSGIGAPSQSKDKVLERVAKLGLTHTPRAHNVVFWDLLAGSTNAGQDLASLSTTGHPLRTTISEVGPTLLAFLLDLNDTQSSVLQMCFKYADDQSLLILDLKDLSALLSSISDQAGELSKDYGYLPKQSLAAIQRDVIAFQEQGGDHFFGEPALDLQDLLRTNNNGEGVLHLLDATRLIHEYPKLYAVFMIWLLAELFEEMPEVGEVEKPKFVLFFDEAHILFNSAPKTLLEMVERAVRLIRSKGVGLYFVTQDPCDIPDAILGQLGLKVQHGIRAFTPKDRQAIKTIADNFRDNPKVDVADAVTNLGIGEALVSTLDGNGVPNRVERALICPPMSRIGPLNEQERAEVFARSPFHGKYDKGVDRESAYEMLQARALKAQQARADQAQDVKKSKPTKKSQQRQSMGEAMMKSALRSIGSQLGRQIVRGLFGVLKR